MVAGLVIATEGVEAWVPAPADGLSTRPVTWVKEVS